MERIPDLPAKQGRTLADHRTSSERARDEWMANRQKASTPLRNTSVSNGNIPTVRKNRTAPKATWAEREKAVQTKVEQVQKATAKKQAPSQGGTAYKESQHPRDRAGRFAVKAVKATVKGVGKAIKGTAKAVKSVHKTVKRANTIARRNDALAHRERKLDLHKREVAAGLKRPRTVRRKKAAPPKKQGILGRLFGSPAKKQVRRRR